MATYYDDNFGEWENMDDPDMVTFFHQVQKESVEKQCSKCQRVVLLRPAYGICGSCADAIEQGLEY